MSIETLQEVQEKRAISRSVFNVMSGGIFSLLAGFINQMIIAAYFGAGFELDAYLTALVVPAYFHAVLLTGLSFVFIPAFVRETAKGNENGAWDLVGTFFWITTGILVIIAVFGSFFAKEIISLTAPGFGPEKSALAARMLSVLMFSVPFSGLSSYTRGIQNARNRFFWPSFGGAINSIGSILVLVLLTRSIGSMALAWSFVFALLLQSCITVFPVLRHGWTRLVPITDSRIIEMARLILPFILLGLFTSGTTIFERYFASVLPNGQISYLGYAGKISNIYVTLLVTGIATAIFPAMARAYAQSGRDGLGEKTVYGLRLTLAVALPAVLISGALSAPLIKVVFERGQFSPMDTYHVARIVLIVLMSGVLCRMLENIMGRTFFVLKDTITPPVISAVSVVIYICIGRFFAEQWGYIGLAYASLIQASFITVVLYVFLIHKVSGVTLGRNLRSAIIYSLAATGAFLIGKFISAELAFLPALFVFIISAVVSGAFYLTLLYFYDREILIPILEMVGILRIMGIGKNAKANL